MAVIDLVRLKLQSVIQAMSYEYVGCEFVPRGRHGTLRIYIDAASGVTLDDCARISEQVGAMLDVEDPLSCSYDLEVSSPGIERPLFELAHYEKQIGKIVKARLRQRIDGRGQVQGVIDKIVGTDIHLLVDSNEMVIPFATIERARLVIQEI